MNTAHADVLHGQYVGAYLFYLALSYEYNGYYESTYEHTNANTD